MTNCTHVFIGKSNGVHCTKCGLHMNAEEYAKYLKSGEKPKRQIRKKVIENE